MICFPRMQVLRAMRRKNPLTDLESKSKNLGDRGLQVTQPNLIPGIALV